ncbi:MAG: hypothetical protein R3B12_02705 [Candidatus Saccharimonadales bacterium]
MNYNIHNGPLMIETVPLQHQITEVYFNGLSGFGFGNGSISRLQQLKSGELTQENENQALEYILTDPHAFLAVTSLDDGCSDGRRAIIAMQLLAGITNQLQTSTVRAKVFGGGAMMTAAGTIGLGSVAKGPYQQFEDAISLLVQQNQPFGAHDDDHAMGGASGCGAIDNYVTNLHNTQLYASEIRSVLGTLLGDDFNDDVYSTVSENMRKAYSATKDYTEYSGRLVRDDIAQSGVVLKRLSGNHKEDFVVLNYIPGTTLNQAGLAHATQNTVQAFSLDVWRLDDYATLLAQGENQAIKQHALYGMLVYTLATSATLTDGTQRVLIRK